jgi:hypothetical protein
MAVDERRRNSLYDALERRIGLEEATTLMELLPPVGWADVATKEDLRRLEDRIEARLERGFRRMIQWNVGTVMAMAAIVLAVVRLT